MKIYFKKANGQWKLHEPLTARLGQGSNPQMHKFFDMIEIDKNLRVDERKKHLNVLNENMIYLQEFRTGTQTTSVKHFGKKTVRILLNKRLWVSKRSDNSQICMNFSQFNDPDELRRYHQAYYCIPFDRIVSLLNPIADYDPVYKAFCVFISIAPVHLLLHCEGQIIEGTNNSATKDFDFTSEFNTLGKQIKRYQKYELFKFFNHLWGKAIFDDDFVNFKYSLISTDVENKIYK